MYRAEYKLSYFFINNLKIMAFVEQDLNNFVAKCGERHTTRVTDLSTARNAELRLYTGGTNFKKGDKLFFDTDAKGEPILMENNSLDNTVFTCAAVLNRHLNGGKIVEIFPSMIGPRVVTEYVPANGGFAPTNKVIQSTAPHGEFNNPYDYFKALAGVELVCDDVKSVNTLSYNLTRLQKRNVYQWSVVK